MEQGGLDVLDLTKESLRRDEELERLAKAGCGRHLDDGDDPELEKLIHTTSCGTSAYLTNEVAWTYLRMICFCPENLNDADRVFVYPSYLQGRGFSNLERGFARPVTVEEVISRVKAEGEKRLPVTVPDQRKDVVSGLAEDKIRVALDIDTYQHEASNFATIRRQALGK